MGFNQAPQQKQAPQGSWAPQQRKQTTPPRIAQNPYSPPSESGPGEQLQNVGRKGTGQPSPVSAPVLQRSVSNATLQGGAPSGGEDTGQGGVSGFTPDMGNRRAAAMTPPSRNPNAADYNRTLTEPEYQGVMDRERAWSPNAGSTYSGPTLGQAMDQYGGGGANFTLPNGSGEQVSPLDYLKRNPYSHQGRFARLPGAEMEKWKNGTYKG